MRLLERENKTLRAAMGPLVSLRSDVRQLSAKVAILKEERAAVDSACGKLEEDLTLSRLSVQVCSKLFDPVTIFAWPFSSDRLDNCPPE